MRNFHRRALYPGFGITLVLAGLCFGSSKSSSTDSSTSPAFQDEGFGEEDDGFSLGVAPPSTSRSSAEMPMGSGAPPSATAPNKPVISSEASGAAVSPLASSRDTGGKTDLLHMNRNDLFLQAFNKAPPPRSRQFSAQLSLDGQDVEPVTVLWDDHFSEYQFYSKKLEALLDTILTPKTKGEIQRPDGRFVRDGLQKNQFNPVLDEADFSLKLSIPPGLKRAQIHSLQPQAVEARLGEEIKPAHFSAYLNSTWTQDWTYNQRFFPDDSSRAQWERYNGTPEPTRQPLGADVNGAIRTLDWVLLASGSIREPDSGNWSRSSFYRSQTQLVHDFVSWNSRLTLLDVNPVHDGGNFSAPSLGGMDLAFGNALYMNQRNDGTEVKIFLNREADVTVYVNGESIKTLHLPSGEQRIQGILGRAGENNVEIRVVYPGGQTETIPFQFVQASPRVLSVGERDGSMSAGVHRLGEDEYGSSSSDVLVAGTYQQSLTPFTNGKVGLALNENLQVASAVFVWAQDSTSTWDFTATLSRDSLAKLGQKYSLQFYQLIHPASLMATASFIQPSFRNVFFAGPSPQPVRYQFGLTLDGPVWRGNLDVYANVLFNRRLDSLTSPIDYSAGISYQVRAWKGLTLRSMVGIATRDQQLNPTASLTLNYFFNSGRQSVYALNQTSNQKQYVPPQVVRATKTDSVSIANGGVVVNNTDTALLVPGYYQNTWKNLSNAGWAWSDGMGTVGGKSVSVGGNYTANQYGLQIGSQRTSNYADLALNYSLNNQNMTGLTAQSHYLSARVGTSLMFADGAFAIGRPVQDGFVLVTGQNDLSSTDFRINPSSQGNSAYSVGGRFLAASYGLLSPYRVENVKVEPDNPPMGTFLDGDMFWVNNTYQQGFLLKEGKPVRIFVRLRLVDESRQSLRYTSFRVMSLTDTSKALYQSFSSGNGTIQIADLEPGQKYVLRFGEDAFIKDLIITIPKNAPRIYDMGDLKVENQSLSQLSRLSMAKSAPAEGRAPGIATETPPVPKPDPPSARSSY